MPPEDPRLSQTRQWLAKAQEDLALAEHLHGSAAFPAAAVFHSQQAAEKALKAYLAWHNRPLRRTHHLQELVGGCAQIDAGFASLDAAAAALTPYAWEFRYPGDPMEPTRQNVADAVQLARDVVVFALRRLPPEVHS